MANKRAKLSLRPRRIFSDKLKKKIVADIEKGKVSVAGVCREYQVASSAVYKWLKKHSAHLQPSTTVVVQIDSEQYRTKELEKKVTELEAALGRKQLEIDYLNKLIDIASGELHIDLKKIPVLLHQLVQAKQKAKRVQLNWFVRLPADKQAVGTTKAASGA